DLIPVFVRVWQEYLHGAARRHDPVFVPWHAYAALPEHEFAARSADVTKALTERLFGPIHPVVAQKFEFAPSSMADVAARYGALFTAALAKGGDEVLRRVLFDPKGPCVVPDEPIVNIENFFDSDSCNELWKLQNELDNWVLRAPPSWRHGVVLMDR